MDKNPNWFVRTLIIVFALLLVALGVVNVVHADPPGTISTGLVLVIGILTILVLSETYDNFSLGKLLSLSRNVVQKDREIGTLKRENSELREQVITISSSISQRQVSTNIVGLPDSLLQLYSVQQAPEEEVEEKQEEASEKVEAAEVRPRLRPDLRRVEEVGLSHFLRDENLDVFPLMREAKLVSAFHGVDPISDAYPIYDAYVKTVDADIFIEVRLNIGHSIMMRDRIYFMLSKIHHFRRVSKQNAFLALVIVDLPDQDRRYGQPLERVLEHFQPAVSNGLLKIHRVTPTEAEIEQIMQPR